jgi:hypothetical protein
MKKQDESVAEGKRGPIGAANVEGGIYQAKFLQPDGKGSSAMWREYYGPEHLRELLPDVALKMESDVMQNALRGLGLVALRRNGRRITRFEIQMKPHHVLIIEPTDKGTAGYSEWMTWHYHDPQSQCESQQPYFSIRAFVQVFDISSGTRVRKAEFTVHDNSVENVIRNAIFCVKQASGEKLTPVLRRRPS